jgi:hypothetical protein
MSRTRLRIAVATAAVLSMLAGAPDAAHACNLPMITVSPDTAGPGEPVTWKIGDIEAGAAYTVTVAGQVVADGEASASPPSGTFSMPNLGSTPRSVSVEMEVRHTEASATREGGNNAWWNSADVTYRPPSAPPQVTPDSPPTSTPATPPPADGLHGAAPKKRGSTRDRPTEGPRDPGQPMRRPAAREPAPRNPAPTRIPVPVRETEVPDVATPPLGVESRATGRTTVDARSRSTVNALDGSAVATTDRSGVKAREPRTEASERVIRPARPPSRTRPRVHGPGKVVRPLEDGDAIPGIVLVGVSALLVLGVGAVAIWVLYPRGSPPGTRLAAGGPQWIPPGLGLETRSRDLLVEAELQEMIAEERARRLPREGTASRIGHD